MPEDLPEITRKAHRGPIGPVFTVNQMRTYARAKAKAEKAYAVAGSLVAYDLRRAGFFVSSGEPVGADDETPPIFEDATLAPDAWRVVHDRGDKGLHVACEGSTRHVPQEKRTRARRTVREYRQRLKAIQNEQESQNNAPDDGTLG